MRNVYDFDKTIYRGDSTVDFYFYCVWKCPWILRRVPYQCYMMILYKLKKISKTEMKEKFYSFFCDIKDMENLVEQFWDKNMHKIEKWYLKQQEEDDLVISASPEFLLNPICKRIGIYHLLASRVNHRNGKYTGENCYGTEKATRFLYEYPEEKIGQFYSDSKSDQPLADLAQKAYLVKKNHIIKWE